MTTKESTVAASALYKHTLTLQSTSPLVDATLNVERPCTTTYAA